MAQSSSDRIELWPDGAPGGWRIEGPESRVRNEAKVLHVSNVAIPRIERFGDPCPPDAPLCLVVPGGGYWIVAAEHEGEGVARRLAREGIEAWSLTYRLPRPEDAPKWRVPVEDVRRAAELLRGRGPTRTLAAIGFSAGAHAIAVAAAEADDFARVALVYPAYLTREGDASRVAEAVAPTHAVPTFLAVTEDDANRAAEARVYMDAVRRTGAATEERYPPTGGHGYAFEPNGAEAPWLPRLVSFLRDGDTAA